MFAPGTTGPAAKDRRDEPTRVLSIRDGRARPSSSSSAKMTSGPCRAPGAWRGGSRRARARSRRRTSRPTAPRSPSSAGEEGQPEVYTMPAAGGPPRRLTFLGADACSVSGWTPDGTAVLFCSDASAPVRTRDARLSRCDKRRCAAAAGSGPRTLAVAAPRRPLRDRAQQRRSRALEALQRRHGGRPLGRRRGRHLRATRFARRESRLAHVDRRTASSFFPITKASVTCTR